MPSTATLWPDWWPSSSPCFTRQANRSSTLTIRESSNSWRNCLSRRCVCVCMCVSVCGELCGLVVKRLTGNLKVPGSIPTSLHWRKKIFSLGTLPRPKKNSKLGTWPRLGMDKTTGCAYSTKVQVGLRVPTP